MEASNITKDVDMNGTNMPLHVNNDISGGKGSTSVTSLADTKLDYAAQFFGFTPVAFSDGVYNALLLYSWELLEQAQQVIRQEFPEKISEEDSYNASKDIIAKMVKCFERAFDKLELYLTSHIFRIPKNVILPEDLIQEQYPDASQSIEQLDDEIRELKVKIREARVANARLKQEIVDISAVQEELNKTLEYVNDMSKTITPELCESIGYVSGKAVQLKQLLARLDEASIAKAEENLSS